MNIELYKSTKDIINEVRIFNKFDNMSDKKIRKLVSFSIRKAIEKNQLNCKNEQILRNCVVIFVGTTNARLYNRKKENFKVILKGFSCNKVGDII